MLYASEVERSTRCNCEKWVHSLTNNQSKRINKSNQWPIERLLAAMIISTVIKLNILLHAHTYNLGRGVDPWHTLLECESWKNVSRGNWEGEPNAGTLDTIMLRSEEGWNEMFAFVCMTIKRKTEAECRIIIAPHS